MTDPSALVLKIATEDEPAALSAIATLLGFEFGLVDANAGRLRLDLDALAGRVRVELGNGTVGTISRESAILGLRSGQCLASQLLDQIPVSYTHLTLPTKRI